MKLLTILLLLSIIVGVSFYGYNYFINSQKFNNIPLPPVSMQVSDDDLIIEEDEEIIEDNNSLPIVIIPEVKEADEVNIDKIANEVKIAIAKSEIEEENETKVKDIDNKIKIEEINPSKEKSLEIPSLAPEAQYLEELADLSKEIDKERKK
jgi:hypothetical protein